MPNLPATAARALLTSIGNQARTFYSPGNNPFVDPSAFIASEDPAPIFQRPAKQLARAACRSWARQQGPSVNPAADQLYGSACGPYLESIGENPTDGELGLPFEGGQCAGTYYFVLMRFYNPTTGAVSGENTFEGFGPVSIGVSGNQEPGPGNSCLTGQQYYPGRDLRFNGTPRVSFGGGCAVRKTWEVVSITPRGDEPNNCGNPEPIYERPRRPINLPPIIPILVNLTGIGELNVNVEVNLDGSITVESPTLNVEVNLPPPGGGDGGGGGGGGGDVPPPGTPGPPADTGDGGAAEGEAPEGQELVGLRVEVLESPIGVNTYDRVAVTVYRGIGYVRMGYPGRLALDMGGAAVISPQFFFAPVRGLTNWEVRANNGFINRVTPFYRELPS